MEIQLAVSWPLCSDSESDSDSGTAAAERVTLNLPKYNNLIRTWRV